MLVCSGLLSPSHRTPTRSSRTTGAKLRQLARRPRKEVGHVCQDTQVKAGDVENGASDKGASVNGNKLE